jgi:polysaccharide export outer membrane protein
MTLPALRSTKANFLLLAFAIGAVSLSALAQATPELPAGERTGDYVIGPKDLIEVRVLEIPELNVERRVKENGAIDLPMIGEFSLNGKTAVQASERLSAVLTAEYVNRANVSIVVKEFSNKPLSILGAVAQPGSLNIPGKYTLLQAISAAGGLTAQAGKKIFVIRTVENGESQVLEIQTDDLFRSTSAKWNIPVYPSDIVNIPAKTTVKVFCLGEVREPGALEFDSDDRISLLSVIAQAGGLTDRASRKITVTRRGENGRDIETIVDYKDLIGGKITDPTLQADDVVIVKQSFF